MNNKGLNINTKIAFRFLFLIFLFVSCRVFSQEMEPGLVIRPLTGQFYIYTTFMSVNGIPYPSNSLYVVTDKGILLIDTPWNADWTAPLLDSLENKYHQRVVLCVVTHSHDDRTAGLEVLKQRGVATYSSLKTLMISKKNKEKQAEHWFLNDTVFRVGDLTFETYYPGEGHSADNIVVWFPGQKVLFGGCLIKSAAATDLGNVADAGIKQWPRSVRNVQRHFPKPLFVIPGHGDPGDAKLLKHTLKLLR